MGKTKLELLAPAKDLDCGKAAIDHGADAVYIGAERLGARAAAGNSLEDIAALCQYAHPYGVKVYVTLNTLIYEDELEYAKQLLRQFDQIGVDAVLIQDMAILHLLDDLSNELGGLRLRIHASTQTDNRTSDKIKWLRQLGFDRVVLARELTLNDIREIHKSVPDMELEAFVHGSLCVSYSGLCYASEFLKQRSANRGECAQICRMKYDLVDSDGRVWEHDRYLLSLKDLCLYNNLKDLIDAGVTSFKIEGRLKDSGYVKNVTSAYSEKLNEIIADNPERLARSSIGRCTYNFEPDLKKTFNRGYTTYNIYGRKSDIFSPYTPKFVGEYVGRVRDISKSSLTIDGNSKFSNGDGLCFFDNNKELKGLRINKVEPNGRLFPFAMPMELRKGMSLFRNRDKRFEDMLSRQTAERKIPLRMTLNTTSNGFSLEANAIGNEEIRASFSVEAEHQEAKTHQKENIFKQLSRLGGTPYECSSIVIPEDFNYFIPSSVLAQMRRSVVEKLNELSNSMRPVSHFTLKSPELPQDLPYTSHLYMYNASNSLSLHFYNSVTHSGIEKAFELEHPRKALLMQCSHCVKFSLGYCPKHGGIEPNWREPLSLCLGDGTKFRLEFDCKHCVMKVWSP